MKRSKWSGYIWFLACWLISFASYGQPKSGHLVYDLISYQINDSSHTKPDEVESMLELSSEEWNVEIYYNKTWVVALQKKGGSIIKTMFHRKSLVLYTYTEATDLKRLRIDSIQAIKQKDNDLMVAIDTFKSYLGVTDYPKDTRRIHGFPCYKVTYANSLNSPTLDAIWVTNFKNVPNLVFPDHLYFLIEGIPLEFTQYFGDTKFKWGVVEIKPVKQDDDIFKQESSGYLVTFMDTRKLIYEGNDFIRTYEPKVE
jgi:hypothetical protein